MTTEYPSAETKSARICTTQTAMSAIAPTVLASISVPEIQAAIRTVPEIATTEIPAAIIALPKIATTEIPATISTVPKIAASEIPATTIIAVAEITTPEIPTAGVIKSVPEI